MAEWLEREMTVDEISAEQFYKGMYEGIFQSLCRNHMNQEVAHFLAELAVEVEKLKRHEL